MQRFAAVIIIATAVSGCAVTSVPSLMTFNNGEAPQTAGASPAVAAPQEEEPGALASLWDNFSAPFRGSAKPAAQPVVAGEASVDLSTGRAVELINNYRAQNGVKPLSVNVKLNRAAAILAQDMSRNDRLSHYGPDGAGLEQRLESAGYDFSVAAENIGVGQRSLEEMVAGWKKSPGHSKNMLLADARHMGIALVNRQDSRFKTFWTLVLGAPRY